MSWGICCNGELGKCIRCNETHLGMPTGYKDEEGRHPAFAAWLIEIASQVGKAGVLALDDVL